MTSHHAPGAIGRARHLRREMTLPESQLWAELRKLKLNIRRQAPIGRYVVDFVCHSASLVVEVDGMRHDLPEDQLHDLERTAWLNSQGYRVLRFRNDEVLGDPWGVSEQIRRAIASKKALPLHGGGLGGGARAGDDGNASFGAEPDLRLINAAAPPTLPFPHGGGRVPSE